MLESSDDLPVKNKKVNYNIVTISHVHTYISYYLYPRFFSYCDFPFEFGDISKYKLIKMIGFGKFSSVFLASDGKQRVAIKVYKNVKKPTICREIFILNACKKLDYIVHIHDILKDPNFGYIAIVLDYQKPHSMKTMFEGMTLDQLRLFSYNLFKGIYNLHSHGIIHRDIKPDNILYDNETGDLRITDLGLAEIYYPRKQYTTGLGTLRWMAPELVFDYKFYDYGVDIWAIGITLFEITIKTPCFEVENLFELARELSKMLTPTKILEYAEKYGIFINNGLLSAMPQINYDRWPGYIEKMKPQFKDDNFINLMRRCLICDHQKRITAREALDHPFFDPLKGSKK